jgi:chromosome segregation ATPase
MTMPNANVNPEGTPVTTPNPPAGIPATQPIASQPQQTFTAEQVEAFRQQEKDKLYQAQEALRKSNETMQAELAKYKSAEDARETEAAATAAALAAEKKAHDEEELSAKELLAKRDEEWRNQFAQLQADRNRDRALLEKEREYSALQQYIARRVTEERDDIEENLLDLVTGSTPEEVEASIVSMKQRSMRIMENARQNGVMTRAAMPGVSSAAGNVGPLDQLGEPREPTAEEIANFAPGSPEHLAARARYGIGRPQATSMFG